MRGFAVAFAGAMLFAGAAFAQDCSLDQIASLPITTLPDGTIAVPVNVDGSRVLLAVSMQAPHTALDAAYVRGLGMDSSGPVALESFGMGQSRVDNVTVGEIAASAPGTAGVLGVDTLREYDVEIDFRNAKLKLFAHSHCPGDVVYWANSYTVVPFQVDASGQIVAQMTLDGKPVRVGLSSAPGHALMDTSDHTSPYKLLTMNAVSIANPQIDDAPRKCGAGCGPDLYIRLSELKLLHLFFAFSEDKLYVTP